MGKNVCRKRQKAMQFVRAELMKGTPSYGSSFTENPTLVYMKKEIKWMIAALDEDNIKQGSKKANKEREKFRKTRMRCVKNKLMEKLDETSKYYMVELSVTLVDKMRLVLKATEDQEEKTKMDKDGVKKEVSRTKPAEEAFEKNIDKIIKDRNLSDSSFNRGMIGMMKGRRI